VPNKTLYVRDGDEAVWEAASRVARRNRISLSRLVTDALEAHLPTAAAEPTRTDRWSHFATDDPTAA
jgi:hypothetical protein